MTRARSLGVGPRRWPRGPGTSSADHRAPLALQPVGRATAHGGEGGSTRTSHQGRARSPATPSSRRPRDAGCSCGAARSFFFNRDVLVLLCHCPLPDPPTRVEREVRHRAPAGPSTLADTYRHRAGRRPRARVRRPSGPSALTRRGGRPGVARHLHLGLRAVTAAPARHRLIVKREPSPSSPSVCHGPPLPPSLDVHVPFAVASSPTFSMLNPLPARQQRSLMRRLTPLTAAQVGQAGRSRRPAVTAPCPGAPRGRLRPLSKRPVCHINRRASFEAAPDPAHCRLGAAVSARVPG